MNRYLAAGLLGLVCLASVWAQKDEETPLLRLVNRCVADGGLKRVPAPGGKGTLLVLDDEKKLKATARDRPELWTPEVREVLVSAWFEAGPEQQAVVVALLRTFGEARDDNAALGSAAYFTAVRYERDGRPRDAIGEYTKAVEKFVAARDRASEANALSGIGGAYVTLKDYPKALEYHGQALALQQQLHKGPHDAVALCQLQLGSVYARQENYTDAQKHFEAALAIYRKLHPDPNADTAFALDVLAVNYKDQEELDKALECYTEALKIRRALSPPPRADIAQTLVNLGGVQSRRNEPRQAREHYLEALQIQQQLHPGPHPDVAEVLNALGDVATQMGLFDEALHYHRDALETWRQVVPEPVAQVADALDSVGDAYEHKGAYARALEYHQEALARRQKLYGSRPHADLAYSHVKIGSVHFRAGELREMVASFEQGEAMIRRVHTEPHPDLARYLNILGSAYEKSGRDADALRCFEEAYQVCGKVFARPHAVTVHSLTGLAAVHRWRQEPAKAEEYLRQALDLTGQVPNGATAQLIAVHDGFASLFLDRFEFARAEEHHRQALALARAAHGDVHPEVASALEELARVQDLAGDHEAALASAKSALAQWEKIHGGPHPDVARAARLVGDLYSRRDDAERALGFHQRALEAERAYFSAPNEDIASGLLAVGEDFARLGDGTRALAQCEEALAALAKVFDPPNEQLALALESTAAVCLRLGDAARALEYSERALAAYRQLHPEGHPAVARLLLSTGSARALRGDHDGALADYDRALVCLRSRGTGAPESAEDLLPSVLTVDVLRVRAMELEKQAADPENLRAAERSCALGVALLERVRRETLERDSSRLGLGAHVSELVPRDVGLCARLFETQGKAEYLRTAYLTIERNRARVFLDGLRQARAGLLAGVPAPLRDREADLRRRLRVYEDQTARLEALPGEEAARQGLRLWQEREGMENDLGQLDAEIAKAYPAVAPVLLPEPCSLADARACLGDGEVALFFALGGDASWVLLVEKKPAPDDKGQGLAAYRLPKRADLEGEVAALADADTLALPARVRELGAELYAKLLAPLAGRLRGKDLVIVPDGPLGYLPFELLVEPTDGGSRFLVEGHRIRYAPSLTALDVVRRWLAKREREPDRTLWAMGDPVYNPRDARFPPLVFSRHEVEAVGDLLGVRRETLLLGKDAVEARVKADSQSGALGRRRYIHFATHGTLGQGNHQLPALVLAQAGNDGKADDYGINDGFLRLDEVLNLRLNADLVVLSSCQSGRGQLYDAEGVSGLARAFLYAGSKGVVCSLWSVDDKETAGFMVAMYSRLKADHAAADALRETRLEMIRAGKAPLYWAPFILIGE
jgi:CHAT domain-containing protein/tetratricopeptide (TPR) repeat protein